MSPKRQRKKITDENQDKSNSPPDYDDVLSKVKSVAEVEKYLKALIIGPTGTGKTTTLATFPKPMLILDFREGGTDSISHYGDEIKVLPVEDVEEVEQIYWYLYGEDHPYQTVAWENVAQAQDLFVKKVKEEEGKGADAPTHKGIWGNAASKFKNWIMNYRELSMHTVFTSHPRVTESEEEADESGSIAPEVGPRTMPSVATTLVGSVNIVGHTFIRESTKRDNDGHLHRKMQYAMRLGPHPYYHTKIRKPPHLGVTPEYIINPDFDTLLKITRGEYEEGSSKKAKKPKKKTKEVEANA